MSITITGEFPNPLQARQAAQKLRRRGYTVSGRPKPPTEGISGNLLVAYPYGAPGGNSAGNQLMGALPPMAGNGVTIQECSLVSVLTDDTQAVDCRRLMEALGGRIL